MDTSFNSADAHLGITACTQEAHANLAITACAQEAGDPSSLPYIVWEGANPQHSDLTGRLGGGTLQPSCWSYSTMQYKAKFMRPRERRMTKLFLVPKATSGSKSNGVYSWRKDPAVSIKHPPSLLPHFATTSQDTWLDGPMAWPSSWKLLCFYAFICKQGTSSPCPLIK